MMRIALLFAVSAFGVNAFAETEQPLQIGRTFYPRSYSFIAEALTEQPNLQSIINGEIDLNLPLSDCLDFRGIWHGKCAFNGSHYANAVRINQLGCHSVYVSNSLGSTVRYVIGGPTESVKDYSASETASGPKQSAAQCFDNWFTEHPQIVCQIRVNIFNCYQQTTPQQIRQHQPK